MMTRTSRSTPLALTLVALLLTALTACSSAAPPSAPATPAIPGAATPASAQAAVPPPTAAAPAPNSPGHPPLTIGLNTWPDTLAPQKASYQNEVDVLMLNYEGLTRFDKDLKTVPAAAERWQYNADASAITFTLREGLSYSDGAPLTARDFRRAIERTLDPRTPGDYQGALGMVAGAEALIGTAVPTDEARLPERFQALGIDTPDDRTLVVRFARPTPYFHTLAALWVLYPARQDLIDRGGEQWYEDPANQIGNGPFQIVAIDRVNSRIDLVANQRYWAGPPALPALRLRYIPDRSVMLQAYIGGEIDIFAPDPNDIATIKNDAQLRRAYTQYPGACTVVLSFNLRRPPFDNPGVRQAFAYGFDREGYVRDALKDSEAPALTWIAPGYPGYDPGEQRYRFDPARARAALAQAGYPDGAGLPPLKFTYDSSNPAERPRAEYLAQMYRGSLGVTIELDPVDGTTLASLNKSNDTYPQMAFGGWCADYPDPQDWLSIFWASDSNFARNMGYANPQVDALLARADADTDQARRLQLYAQAQRLVVGDAPKIMRSNTLNIYMVRPSVGGLELSPQDWSFPGQVTSLLHATIRGG